MTTPLISSAIGGTGDLKIMSGKSLNREKAPKFYSYFKHLFETNMNKLHTVSEKCLRYDLLAKQNHIRVCGKVCNNKV